MKFSTQLLGLNETIKRLSLLDEKLRRKHLKKAVSAGATPTLNAMRAKVAVRTGLLRASLTKKIKSYKGGAVANATIGARSIKLVDKKGKKINPARMVHLVEKGSSNQAAQPFMRPAAEQTKSESISIVAKTLADGIAAEVKLMGPGKVRG